MAPQQIAISMALFTTFSIFLSFTVAYICNKGTLSSLWIALGFVLGTIIGFLGVFPANILKTLIFDIPPEIQNSEVVPLISTSFWCSIVGSAIGVFAGRNEAKIRYRRNL